jgi:hypothetical protein
MRRGGVLEAKPVAQGGSFSKALMCAFERGLDGRIGRIAVAGGCRQLKGLSYPNGGSPEKAAVAQEAGNFGNFGNGEGGSLHEAKQWHALL